MGRHDDDDLDDEIELVLFQGALNDAIPDLKANARLAQAGLIPAKELVTDAIERRARKVIVEPKGDRAAVRMLIDGILYPGGALPGRKAMAITQMLKLLSGLDPKDRRTAQQGGVRAELEGHPYEVRVATQPGPGGAERLTLRIFSTKEILRKPVDVGFTEELKGKIREATSQKKGVFLVCGPAESGTSTTTFVVLHTIDAYLYSVYSIADTDGREMINVGEYTPDDPAEPVDVQFDKMIRKEADVIFVDPIQDAESAKRIFEYQKKVAFLAEFPAKDPYQAIQQLVEWVGDSELVATGLHGIMTQKLLRKLCDKCREAFRPNPKMLLKMGLPPETKVLYREASPPPPPEKGEEEPEPCSKCDGIGYFGEVACYELLEVNDEIGQLIRSGAEPIEYKKQARESGMITLQRDGLRLVVEGITSLEELQRVFAAQRKKKRPRR